MNKRKQSPPPPPPTPLGVVEFTAALNGDDPHLILKRLRQFVEVTRYERRLALSSLRADSIDVDDDDDDDDDEGDTEDELPLPSFDDLDDLDDDGDPRPSKRGRRSSNATKTKTKTNTSTTTEQPSWTVDSKGYGVPFVGTSMTGGGGRSSTTMTTTTTEADSGSNRWPTGFLREYIRSSPGGVELIDNDYLDTLCSSTSSSSRRSTTPPKDDATFAVPSVAALRYYRWSALYEWTMGNVPPAKHHHHHHHHRGLLGDVRRGKTAAMKGRTTAPPAVMTLARRLLPGWIDAIRDYARREVEGGRARQQQQPRQRKKPRDDDGVQEEERRRNNPNDDEEEEDGIIALERRTHGVEELLLLSSLRNMNALCRVSDGIAREVLRGMSHGASARVGDDDDGDRADDDPNRTKVRGGGRGRGGGKFGSGGRGGGGRGAPVVVGRLPGDGTSWMTHLFRSRSTSSTSCRPRIECLRLACTLMETNDGAILSRLTGVPSPRPHSVGRGGGNKNGGPSSSSSGDKEFGLAHIALRYGIQGLLDLGAEEEDRGKGEDDDVRRQIDSYARWMTRLLRDVREIILSPASGGDIARGSDGSGSKRGNTFGIDAKAEFLTGDVLNNLTRLSQLAPPFDATAESVQSIVDAKDRHDGLGPIEVASVEARRILFLLLADTRRSPFLVGARRTEVKSGQSTKDEDRSSPRLSQIAIALHGVLANHGHGPSTKMLLEICLKNTPELVPHFFRGLQLSDPKAAYRSLATLTFVEDVVREAPLPSIWSGSLPVEQLLSAIIPPCITKTLLGKIVQNPSALLVSSGLKLIITLLRRGRECASAFMTTTDKGADEELSTQLRSSILHAILCHLPDVALLLSIPSRFDPFENRLAPSTSRANSLVVLQLCEAVKYYGRLDSTLMTNVKFDWAKLVPNVNDEQTQGRTFSRAEPLLQLRILQTLLLLSRLKKSPFSSKMLPNVISILISTNIPEVYTKARKLAVMLMERNLFSEFIDFDSSHIAEIGQCNAYESSLWIDGISADIADKLVRMIEESKQQRVEQKIMISQALFKASVGCARLGISSFLVWSISRLFSDRESKVSNKLSLLTVQVATKMLLYLADPRPFAGIIAWQVQGSVHEHVPGDKLVAGLYHVAKSILQKDPKTNLLIESLTSDVFYVSSSQILNSQISNGDKKEISPYADATIMRQCLSMMHYSGEHNEKLNILLRKILIGIIETGDNVSGVISRLGLMYNLHSPKTAEMETIIMLLLSAPTTKEFDVEISDLLNRDANIKPDSIAMEVSSALLRCSLVRANHESTFISDVLRFCADAFKSTDRHTSGLKHFLLMILMHTIPAKEKAASFSLPPGAMFDLWAILAGNPTTEMSVKICLRLESCLSALFGATCGRGAWVVYQRVCSITPKVFVNLWLNSLEKAEASYDYTSSLLQSVLKYDCSQFYCLSSLFTSIANDSKIAKLWDSGALDAAAATFVLQTYKQKAAKEIIAHSSWAEVASIVGRKFLALLVRKDQNQMICATDVSFALILDVLEALCSNQLILDMQKSLLRFFDQFAVLPIEHEIQMMRLTKIICAEPSSSLLLTQAFLRCCKLLPKHVKKMIQTSPMAEACSLETLIYMLASLIENARSFDRDTVLQSSNTVDKCLVACLKYGLSVPNYASSCSIFGGCLKIVRLLMVKAHDPSSSTQVALGSLTPSQVHAMAISHSLFQVALSNGNRAGTESSLVPEGSKFCNGLTQQLELIRLLLCIVSGLGRDVKIDIDTWTTILSVYNASTDVVDRLLRRLMFLYEISGCRQDEISAMNDLRWGPATKHIENVSEEESWEWFVDALDIDRIRYTLCQFPVADTLEPKCNNDVERATNHEHNIKHDEQLVFSDGIEDETDDDSSSVTPQKYARDPDTARDGGYDIWRGDGDDIRYSPGFILPLIFATLEAYYPQEKGNSNACIENSAEVSPDEENADRDEENEADCHAFGNMCRRVSDRGGIALAIASLSSRCPSIRQLAIAICGLFLKALQMKESHGIKSWRERPQQEMLMSSIQRGLAVRRSIQMQKQDTMEGVELGGMTAEKVLNIPMLPAVSAVFLAKALLVLSKAGDDMYGQMNRYFLRLTDYHGAFQDCFGLPAFLSLYCSSSDEPSRCRTERSWALLSLRDGAVDEYCYRIISQHHVPELIMSSFDSMIDDPESKSELYLTIDVIETLIQSGGVRASNHLLKGQGLLSWLHGVLGWRKISSVFPCVALKCKFINLITAAVNSYRCTVHAGNDGELDEAQMFYEKVPLANAVIRLCLDGNYTMGQGDSPPDSLTLLGSTCNALWAINLAGRHSQVTSVYGTTALCDMTSLLTKFVDGEIMFEKVLSSICDLPLVPNETDLSSAKLFSSLALGFILDTKTKLSPDTILLSMKRVNELMEINPCLRDDVKITAQVINCRQLAVLAGGIDVWHSFLPFVGHLV